MTAFNITMQKVNRRWKREITATGTINNNGGLAMYMGELNEFFKKGWKGSRIIARFIVASPGSSEALKGYWFQLCCYPNVPTRAIWEAGERLTEEQTERRLRGVFPNYVRRAGQRGNREIFHELRTVAGIVERRVNRAYRNTQTDCRRGIQHVYWRPPERCKVCFASVTESVRITRWRVGGLFATNTRQSITAG